MKRPTVKQCLSPKLLMIVTFSAAAGIGSTYAAAQSLTAAEAQQRYQTDVERCRSGQTSQDERTCLREAGAALEEARRNQLVTGPASFDEHQRARCDSLTGAQHDDCLRLMSDPGATVYGSVEGGGILRETTITVPADSTMPAPADSTVPGSTAPAYGTEPTPYAPAGPGAGGLAPAAPASDGLTPAPAPAAPASDGLAPAPAPAPVPLQ